MLAAVTDMLEKGDFVENGMLVKLVVGELTEGDLVLVKNSRLLILMAAEVAGVVIVPKNISLIFGAAVENGDLVVRRNGAEIQL